MLDSKNVADIKIAFEHRIMMVPLSAILPLRQVSASIKATVKYRRIAKSVAEVGIIEPLMIAPQPGEKDRYLLLDGHMRREALIDLDMAEVRCLISHDDEAFTFNKRVSHLATVQEHFMIVRALERGVSEEKLANALDINIQNIKRRKTMLDGICPEVVELLKDRTLSPVTFDVLRKMKPMRQMEAAELMVSAGNFTSTYAKALLAATGQNDLVRPDKPKKINGMTHEQMARMEREMASLQQDFKAVEATYGDDVLNLVIASGFVSKLLGNRKIERYLVQHHPEILQEFKAIVSAVSLDHTSVDVSH
jgi:ParB-like chromosome segregation protein Spo0J